jgi:hypothetical protein
MKRKPSWLRCNKLAPRGLVTAYSEPTPVLKPGIIYSSDNGRLICVQCAGASAKFTGHDISGQAVTALPASETVEWHAEFGRPMSCESGCTTYPLPT